MADSINYITQEGKDQLEAELRYLETEKRAEIGERIKVAREFGDISENSEYDDAKNEQARIEARISEINTILANSMVVNSSKRSAKVNIGRVVTIEMDGKERVFTIVGAAESNVKDGKISNESPVGQAILGHKKGESVVSVGPTGREVQITILKIEN